MNKQFLTIALAAIGLVTANRSSAQNATFYACEGTSFTLKMTNSTSYTSFEWKDYSNTTVLATTADYVPSSTLSTASTAEKRQYLVRGKSAAADCYSEWDTITVYMLPAPAVTITDDGPYCATDFQSAIMTATAGTYDFSALPSTPSFLPIDWTGSSAGTASGANNETYTGTVLAGTYNAKLKYDLTTLSTNDGTKVDCEGTDSHTLTTNTGTTTTAPVITIQ